MAYEINPQTGERELVITITRGNEAPARPRWLMVALWLGALALVYRASR